MEVSTAGLRKPVRELYPHPEFLAACRARDVPVTLASDAHSPDLVGRDFDQALELLRGAGYETVTVFEQRRRTSGAARMSLRVGIGVDAHAFEDGVPLVLARRAFESPRGLAGHSDGDVITHALIDAVLGAAGLGDIGSLFPSDASTPIGISSLDLLRDAVARVRAAGYAVSSADCVLIGEEPRISDRRVEMADALSAVVVRP